MSYQQITFATLKSQAAARLGNSTFWSDTELGLYINEAVRLWNLYALRWHGRQLIPTTQNTIFYDIDSLITATVTDQNLLNEAQYHTQETPNSGASMTSDLWTVAEWINLLNNRTRFFVSETKLKVSRTSKATIPQETRYDLNDFSANLVDIVRAAWVDLSSHSYELQRNDEMVADLLHQAWPYSFGTPELYSISAVQPTQIIDLIPAPNDAGSLHLYYTDLGTTLSNSGVVIPVPNDFAPFLKWGLLADAFSKEGQAFDDLRSQYAEARFQEGVVLGQHWITRRPLRVEFNERVMDRTSLYELDQLNPGWQQDAAAASTEWFPLGAFTIGIHPAADTANQQLVVEGQKNAPVMTVDGDYLDLGQWEVQRILDYVEHIALFKVGGEEFQASFDLLRNFQEAASRNGMRLDVSGIFRKQMGTDTEALGFRILKPHAKMATSNE